MLELGLPLEVLPPELRLQAERGLYDREILVAMREVQGVVTENYVRREAKDGMEQEEMPLHLSFKGNIICGSLSMRSKTNMAKLLVNRIGW